MLALYPEQSQKVQRQVKNKKSHAELGLQQQVLDSWMLALWNEINLIICATANAYADAPSSQKHSSSCSVASAGGTFARCARGSWMGPRSVMPSTIGTLWLLVLNMLATIVSTPFMPSLLLSFRTSAEKRGEEAGKCTVKSGIIYPLSLTSPHKSSQHG